MSVLVRLPLAGTVLEIKDGCVCGDNNDPVRPVGVDLGNELNCYCEAASTAIGDAWFARTMDLCRECFPGSRAAT